MATSTQIQNKRRNGEANIEGGKGEMARGKKDEGALKDGRTAPIFIHSAIDDLTDLTPNTMRVYMHLARRADKSGAAWPSYQSIGDHCFGGIYKNAESRRRHAMAAIEELIKAQLIFKESRMNELGFQSNHYVLLDPPITTLVIPRSLPSDPTITTPSDPTVPTLVIPGSLKGTPLEGTPLEGTPKGDHAPDGAPPLDFLEELCFICHGHKETTSLTERDIERLRAEAKKIHAAGFSIADLRAWMTGHWFKGWRWMKGQQRPTPAQVRSSIPVLRELFTPEPEPERKTYSQYTTYLDGTP